MIIFSDFREPVFHSKDPNRVQYLLRQMLCYVFQ